MEPRIYNRATSALTSIEQRICNGIHTSTVQYGCRHMQVRGRNICTHDCAPTHSAAKCIVKPLFPHVTFKNAQSQTGGAHTHTPSTQCDGLSSVLSVPTLSWVNRSFSRGLRGLGRLTFSEAACLVETGLWMSQWRSGSWGPIHLQSFCQSKWCVENERTLWHCC